MRHMPPIFDILKWWKQKINDFSVDSAIARDIVACPVFTVALKQTFGTLGQNIRLQTI